MIFHNLYSIYGDCFLNPVVINKDALCLDKKPVIIYSHKSRLHLVSTEETHALYFGQGFQKLLVIG